MNRTKPGSIQLQARGNIALLIIDNLECHNAVSVEMWAALRKMVERLGAEGSFGCVVLTGAGHDFSAGADIAEFARQRSTREQVTRYHESYAGPVLEAILACPIPTVAMIRGVCMGGGLEIASMCDVRIAATDARIGIPIKRMGFPLAFGETELLFKLYGRGVLAELLFEGRIYDANEACAKGLVQRAVEPDALEEEVMATAARIATGSPLAQRRGKEQLLRLLRNSAPVTEAERLAYYDFAETEDYRIGYESFLAKRKPVFTGR